MTKCHAHTHTRIQQLPTLSTITTATATAAPSSSAPPLFTDKLVAWDAAAPLAQDFALAVQGM